MAFIGLNVILFSNVSAVIDRVSLGRYWTRHWTANFLSFWVSFMFHVWYSSNYTWLNTHAAYTQHNTFFISLVYMHARAHKINNIETFKQSTRVCSRHVHDNLHKQACIHKQACMSLMYMPNLVHMHIDMYMNCKPRMMVWTLWTCSYTKTRLWFSSWHKTQMPLTISYCKAKTHIPYLDSCLLAIINGNSRINSNVANECWYLNVYT